MGANKLVNKSNQVERIRRQSLDFWLSQSQMGGFLSMDVLDSLDECKTSDCQRYLNYNSLSYFYM